MANADGMVTRRALLGGAAALGAAAVGAGALGGVTEARADEVSWDGEYDVVVVGAGAAGTTCALTVTTEGDGATCLLLEKGESPMGNTPYSGGGALYILPDHRDDAREYLGFLTGNATPDDVLDAFADGLLEQVDWLQEMGAEPDDFVHKAYLDDGDSAEYDEAYDGRGIGYIWFPTDGKYGHIANFLLEKATSADGVTYMPSTPMERLVQDPETKRILGVVAGGKSYRASRGVVMCCGGFESDPELVRTCFGVEGARPYAGAGNTGDGHRACAAAGADMWHMFGGALFWMGTRDLDDTRYLSTAWNFNNKQYGITVGVNGRRFYMDDDGLVVNPEHGSDMACNVGYRHGITQFGGNWTHLPLPPKAWYVFDSDGLAGAVPADKSDDPVADGWCLEADSVEELAGLIDVPADELAKTVDAWNSFCEGGEDLAFYRPSDTLNPVKKAPFYAMLCTPAILNTDGGPRRDGEARVLDPFGEAIPGLYSAGEFGSVWGHFYQGDGNIGEALVFGRIAARSALAQE